jgi:hypothetical protein
VVWVGLCDFESFAILGAIVADEADGFEDVEVVEQTLQAL